jgi:uncharacterized glyoxalase superfamily protein PhnB
MRFEPGVGGRFIQLGDGDADRELGRITVWRPGSRLAYDSADGSVVEVLFEPEGDRTRVEVEQRGTGMGGWANILEWFRHRAQDGYRAREMPRITPVLLYPDPREAAAWLTRAFGFWCRGVLGSELAELELSGGVVMLRRAGDQPVNVSMIYAYVDDLEAHLAHAEAAGARIVQGIERRGDTAYVAEDIGSHRWTFAQARASMRAANA